MFIKERKVKGAIFFVLVCLVISLALTAVLIGYTLFSYKSGQKNQTAGGMDKNSVFSNEQEQALKNLGVTSSSLPKQFSPAQMDCITKALGEARTKEIFEQKVIPQTNELLLASPCLRI